MMVHSHNKASSPANKAVEGSPKTRGESRDQLGDPSRLGMGVLSRFKGAGFVVLLLAPNGEQDAYPDIGQGSHGNRMALAFCAFAQVILLRPRLRAGTVKGKLLEGVAQGLDTAEAAMGLGIRATLIEDWRGSSQSLQALCRWIATPIIADLSQQTRSQTNSCARQGQKTLVVLMRKKKAFNFLIIGCDLFDQRFQLIKNGQKQPGLGAGRDLIGLQGWLLEVRNDATGRRPRSRIALVSQQGLHLRDLSFAGLVRGRELAQKGQCRRLIQVAEKSQGDGIICLEASRELVEQAGLHLDQSILVAGQLLEFLDQLAIRAEPTQIGKIGSPGLGKQIGINGIGFGPRRGTVSVNGARVHRIDRPPSLQQETDQETVGRLDHAGNLLLAWSISYLLQILMQVLQPFRRMGHPDRSQLPTLLINGQGIMIG